MGLSEMVRAYQNQEKLLHQERPMHQERLLYQEQEWGLCREQESDCLRVIRFSLTNRRQQQQPQL